MIQFRHVHLYGESSSPALHLEQVADYVRSLLKCDVDVREEFFTHFLTQDKIEWVASRMAATKVYDPRKPFAEHEPVPMEVAFEKKTLSAPAGRYLGILYDGHELQSLLNELVPEQENSLEHVHVVFTNRLVCTYSEDDLRYHYRTVVCGYPAIVCTSGMVEAPAKPRGFYVMQQYYASMGNANLEEIKKSFAGRFIDYDDERLTEVVKGIVLQGLFYYIGGEPFCERKECRLFNAHWQEDLIASQLGSGKLCDNHMKMLQQFNEQCP